MFASHFAGTLNSPVHSPGKQILGSSANFQEHGILTNGSGNGISNVNNSRKCFASAAF